MTEDEAKQMAKFFWGELPISDLPTGIKQLDFWGVPAACSHEWAEVILFDRPHLRCKFCDIKQSEYIAKEVK